MNLSIVNIGNPVLRKKTSKVAPKLRKSRPFLRFVQDMVSTMRHAQGVGLAANQVQAGLRVMVLECRKNRRYPKAASFPLQSYINPKIVQYSKRKQKGWEGCLSIPGFRGVVPRAYSVTFTATTLQGKSVRKTVSGFEARVVQHEVDHLNGFFYVDRMEGLRTWTHLEEFNRRHQVKIRDRRG